MPVLRTIALFFLCTTPSLAHDLDWWGDGVAEAPEASEAVEVVEPVVIAPRVGAAVDLADMRALLQAGMSRVVEGVDPVQALPWTVTPAPPTTAAELRGLLAASGATQVKLEGVQVDLTFFRGDRRLRAVRAMLRPSERSALLNLEDATLPGGALSLPGGPGQAWRAATIALSNAWGAAPCDGVPAVTNEALVDLVPARFLALAESQRDQGVKLEVAVCLFVSAEAWDRSELRLVELHFNLLDAEGVLRGGLNVRASETADGVLLSYPRFKKLPPADLPLPQSGGR
ncbi:MAG: hypothetical protein ACI9MC_004231 [Kiritimatiellia bacterium]